MTLLSIVCMRIWFARMYDRYDINIRIVTEIWSMKYVHQGESWSWWGERRCSSRKLEDVLVSDGGTLACHWSLVTCSAVRISSLFVSILERSLTISPRDRLKPHAAYLIIAVSKSSSPPKPGSVSNMHTFTWAQSRTLNGCTLWFCIQKEAKIGKRTSNK